MAIIDSDDKFKEMLPQWHETRAAISGKIAVLKMAEQSLVCPDFKPTYYKNGDNKIVPDPLSVIKKKNDYWRRAKYLNATGRTKDSFSGMIWSKPPEVEKPPQLNYMDESERGEYKTLREVSQCVSSELLETSRYGILVDMPSVEDASALQNTDGTASPNMIGYTAEQIFYSRGPGLQEVRLYETYMVQNGIDWEEEKQVRQLVLIDGIYHNIVWRDDKVISDVTPIMNGSTMSFIPFQFFGSENNSPDYSKVVLFDLASLNLGHFNTDAEMRQFMHYHLNPMTNVYLTDTDSLYEMNPNGIDVNANGINVFQADDRVEKIETTPSQLGFESMDRDENRMVMLGAQLVTNNETSETLGAKRIDSNANTSVLKQLTENASMGIEQCLRWCADFLDLPGADIKFKLNTQFVTDDMDSNMLSQHIVAVQSGLLPQTSLFSSARKAGLTKKDDDDLIGDLGNQSMGIQGTSEEIAALIAENEALKEQLAAE